MRLVRVSTGQTVRRIGRGSARSQFSFDARTGRIAVCGATSVQVIAGDTGEVEVELPQGNIYNPLVAWRPGGEYLAAWTDTDGIALWNLKSRAKAYTFPHTGMPGRLTFNEDGSILATQSLWDQRLLAWDVGTTQRLLDVPEFVSHACDSGPDGRIVFLTLRLDDIVESELVAGACGALAQTLQMPLGYWGKLSVSPEGRIVAFSGAQGLELWDIKDETTTLRLVHRSVLGRFRRRGSPDPWMQIRHLSFVAPCRDDRQPDPHDPAADTKSNTRTVVRFAAGRATCRLH